MTIGTPREEKGATFDAAPNVLAFTNPVVAGDLIVIGAHQDSNTATEFVVGDCTKTSGTATISAIQLDAQAAIQLSGSVPLRVGIWSCLVTGNGTLEFTIAGGSVYGLVHLGAYPADNWSTDRLEDFAQNESDTDDSDATTGDMTSAGAALFFAVDGNQYSGNISIDQDAAWTLIYEQEDGTIHPTGNSCRRIVGTGTTDAGDWILGATLGWVAVGAVYKEAGGGPPPITDGPPLVVVQSNLRF